MATVEVKEPEVINAEFVDNIAPESRFAKEVQNRGVEPVVLEETAIDPMTIDPRTLYQTAEQYEIAAQKMTQIRDGFTGQVLDIEQQRADLERLYEKSDKPLGKLSTASTVLASAVIVPKLGEIFLDNVYNPEKMAQDGLNAAVNTMGKNTNWNPLNWVSNLVNGSYNVENMQHHVEEAITNVSGKNLANAITPHTDDMIQAAGIDGQTQKAFNELDKNFIKISKLPSNNKLFDKAERLINNVTNKLTSEMKPELHDLSSSISTVDPLNKTKGVLMQSVELSYEAAKDAAIQAVQGDDKVHGHLLGNAQEIQQEILKGVSNTNSGQDGMEVLAKKVKEDLKDNKIAEGMMWARDKIADQKVKTAIVAGLSIAGAVVAYVGVNHINNKRQENLAHIGEQKVATEAEQQLWTQRVGSANEYANQARTAANNIVKLGDFRTRLEQQKTNSTPAIT